MASPRPLLIKQANNFFSAGNLREAIGCYKSCLEHLQSSPNAPASLVDHCIKRIEQCRSQLPDIVALATERDPISTSTTKSSTNDPAVSYWSEKYFYTRNPIQRLPLVSVIIPHHNSSGLLYKAIDSLQKQSFREIEVIIVDDFSSDGSLSEERLASYPSWMRLRLIRLASNCGPARSRNIGVSLSTGRGICFLDADDWLDEKVLQERWQVMERDPMVAAAFSTMTYVDSGGKKLGPEILKGSHSFSYADFISNKFPCSALLFRRRAVVLDPFKEELVFGEDYECFSRIAQRGGVYRIAQGTVWYRQHGNSLTHKDASTDLLQRVETTRYVHGRQLSWAYVGYTRNLAEALVVESASMRAFPIACIYALRNQTEKALQLSKLIDPDVVASKSPSGVAGTIRFFITREEFCPTDKVVAMLAKLNLDTLLRFLEGFFNVRHQLFLSTLIDNLLPSAKGRKNYVRSFHALSWITCTWGQFIKGPSAYNTWQGYVAIHRSNEHFPEAAQRACAEFLASRADLEGLFAFRLCSNEKEMLVDIDSIAPADPDSAEIKRLGHDLSPALFLHEHAARALWALLMHPPKETAEPILLSTDAVIIERKCLEGVRKLRLKVVGGIASCHVLCDQTV